MGFMAGGNAINEMIENGMQVEFIAVNTDVKI